MYLNVFLASFKDGLRTKSNLLWNIIFPIILGTLFFGAFSSIYEKQSERVIKVGIVGSDTVIEKALESIEYDDGKNMFQIRIVEEEEIYDLLKSKKISGIVEELENKDVKVYIGENDVTQSILCDVIGQYRQAIFSGKSTRTELREYAVSKGMAGENKDPYIIYFYNLIAMIAIMGAMNSFLSLTTSAVGESSVGIRELVAPINKPIYEFIKLMAAMCFQIMAVIIALVYYIYILDISFGTDIGYIFLTSILAVIFGQSLGFAIAHFYTLKLNTKVAMVMVLTLGGGFLSGLYIADIKVWIESTCPIINRINPSSVITDAFYALNVYGVGERYLRSMVYLVICTVVCFAFGLIKARRKQYGSF